MQILDSWRCCPQNTSQWRLHLESHGNFMLVSVRTNSAHPSSSASISSSPKNQGRGMMSCCHSPATGQAPHSSSPTASKSKPNSSLSSKSHSPPAQAVLSAETLGGMGRGDLQQVRAGYYFSQGKVWRNLCPLKAGPADPLQHLWLDPL